MRRLLKQIIFASLLVASAVSCKKSELTSYEQEDMIYIYKDAFNLKRDSVTYSFAIKPASLLIDTVKIPVRIMGVAKTNDREVKLVAIDSATTAVEGLHYSFLPYTIPAGAYTADLPVVIKRTTDMKNQEFRLKLMIVDSKDFKPGVPNSPVAGNYAGAGIQYLIKMNNFLSKPANWDTQLVTYFGTFSQVKYKFVIDVTSKTEFLVGAPPLMSIGEINYFKALCKSKLVEYNAANGPLMDEFGAAVVFP